MKRTNLKRIFSTALLCIVSFVFAESIHEVKKGETLYSISRIYGVSVDSVKAANNLSGNDIKVGQKIKIPSEARQTKTAVAASSKDDGVYTVQKGDTWFGIAKQNGITVAELQKLNASDANDSLKVGQKIKLPAEKKDGNVIAKASSENGGKKSSSSNAGTVSSASDGKIPDLKSNDPHNYSTKKADSTLVWPVKTDEIIYIDGKVGGVSLVAKKNEPVTAIRAGTVMFSGSYRGFGNVVFIQSKTGHIYAYTGLGSIGVNKGDYIDYTSQIGTAGVDAYTGKSKMALMVFQNGQPIDPAKAPRG